MKTLISYYGGKQRLASKIVKYLPKHTVYVEPFCGGAAVLFAKPWPQVANGDHYREIINDIDKQLINFYRVLQGDDSEKLIKRLQLTPYSREEHKLAKSIVRGDIKANALDLAWAYFVNINTSFSNVSRAGWGTGLYGRNFGHTWLNRVFKLPEFLERMSGIHVECYDTVSVIKKWDSPQTLFYCDPPYINTDQGDYRYTVEQYKELIETLKNIKGSFVLSGYENEYVPDFWNKVDFKVRMSSSHGNDRRGLNTERVECIWISDKSDTVRPEIKKLFDSGKFDCFGQFDISGDK